MPLLPTHKKKAGIAEKKPKKILITWMTRPFTWMASTASTHDSYVFTWMDFLIQGLDGGEGRELYVGKSHSSVSEVHSRGWRFLSPQTRPSRAPAEQSKTNQSVKSGCFRPVNSTLLVFRTCWIVLLKKLQRIMLLKARNCMSKDRHGAAFSSGGSSYIHIY